MNYMDGQREEDFDENGFDPTKEAFFSDLMGMEEEIASEAYELLEHAINLIKSKYYDDAIVVLRQAIGVYAQINREEEINAINEKISEVYLLKEKDFREGDIETEKEVVEGEEIKASVETTTLGDEKEPVDQQIIEELIVEAVQLLNDGQKLVQSNNFEGALDNYDKAIEFFEEANNSKGVEKALELIEECYNLKAEYLRSAKKTKPSAPAQEKVEEEQSGEEKLKEEKLQHYIIAKEKEEEISTQAYDLIGRAAELANINQFDQALQLYEEGAKLFKELNWTYEVQKIQETIEQLENKKLVIEKQLKTQKDIIEEQVEPQMGQVETIEQQVREQEEQEKLAKMERIRGIEFQKMENEFLKAQIDNLATEASRMAREYELAMQKAIKKGDLIEECIYPKVIEIYRKVKDLLIDKGWNNEAAIYDDTINIYIQKLGQDKKIRLIEEEKIKKR